MTLDPTSNPPAQEEAEDLQSRLQAIWAGPQGVPSLDDRIRAIVREELAVPRKRDPLVLGPDQRWPPGPDQQETELLQCRGGNKTQAVCSESTLRRADAAAA